MLFSKHPLDPTPPSETQPSCSHLLLHLSHSSPPSSIKKTKKEQDTLGNPTSPKEMWIPCLSLIKNNFGKRPINTFPVTRETREKGRRRRRRASGREEKKREKFDDIWKCVSVCVTGRSESFPWPHTVALTLLTTALMF